MKIKELFGKAISKIYAVFEVEQEWLDTADCYTEFDNSFLIDIPLFPHDDDGYVGYFLLNDGS